MIQTTHRDTYSYNQGKAYAIDVLSSARSTLSEPSLLDDLLRNLEEGCANKPVSFADGIRSIVLLMKVTT